MISRRPFVLSIIIASVISLGAYGIYLRRIETAAMDSSQSHAQQTVHSGNSSSETDAVHHRNFLSTVESSPASEETLQNSSAPVDTHPMPESAYSDGTTGDSALEGDASVIDLHRRVLHRLDHHAYHALLQLILDDERQATGLDEDAAVSLGAAIREFAVGRGMPSDVQSGVSDIQCTAALCTFLEDRNSPFGMIRRSPEWQAIERQGPVPMVWSVWLQTQERQGHGRVYMLRPEIERHRDLLEAIVAAP